MQLKYDNIKGSLILLLTALIWGTGFTAQSAGMAYIAPFTFNCARTLIGGIVLVPVILLFGLLDKTGQRDISLKSTITGGICCGVVLFAAASFQQSGISMTTAGKAGFITALYIIIVPLIELFLYKKASKRIWFCVLIAITGFYLLCIKHDTGISQGDLLVLVCAFLFAVHIMVIDRFNALNADGMLMSCIQFFVAGTLMLLCMFVFEKPTLSGLWAAKLPILYAGVVSSGLGYTLQILGQKYTAPTVATLIMSLESVFAALAGWLILHEYLSPKELVGCALVFAAVLIAQLDTAPSH